jgi:hypothetical protein
MPIKPGDLVMVVKNCGNCKCSIAGKPFVATALKGPADIFCGLKVVANDVAVSGLGHFEIPANWLKRIPPLDELEREQERKELHA